MSIFNNISEELLQKAVDSIRDVKFRDIYMLNKAFGLPEKADPQHSYSHKDDTFGSSRYMYKDPAGNYWRYTNAPEDHEHHHSAHGEPLIDPDQPMPHTAPHFFTPAGMKRSTGIPQGAKPEMNPDYNPEDPTNVWHEAYMDPTTGDKRYTYLDKDIHENVDLFIQHNVRLVDSGILSWRYMANMMFSNGVERDTVLAIMMMLMDQAFISLEDLLKCKVKDVKFIGNTVHIAGRKIVVDDPLLFAIAKLLSGKDPESSCFAMNTAHGLTPVGPGLIGSICKTTGVPHKYLKYWHLTQMYSSIVHRLHEQGLTVDADKEAMKELQAYAGVGVSIDIFVDPSVRKALQFTSMSKSLDNAVRDDYGVVYVRSDLAERTYNELEFSKWLHAQPMHSTDYPTDEESTDEPPADSQQTAGQDQQVSKSVLFVTELPLDVGSKTVIIAPDRLDLSKPMKKSFVVESKLNSKSDGTLSKSLGMTKPVRETNPEFISRVASIYKAIVESPNTDVVVVASKSVILPMLNLAITGNPNNDVVDISNGVRVVFGKSEKGKLILT